MNCRRQANESLGNPENAAVSRHASPQEVESGAGAPALGSGGVSVAFAPGLSRFPWPRFQSPALRTRRADFRHRALQWDRAPRTRNPGTARMEGAGRPAIRNRCTAAILPPAASSVHRRAWSRLDDIEPFRSDPFASARDAIRSLCPPGGVIGSATPAGFRPSRISPHLRPLPSAGIARRLQYCGPLRHPAGPACTSRGSGWRVHATDRASRVATSSIMQTCRRHYPGGNGPVHSSLASRTAVGLVCFENQEGVRRWLWIGWMRIPVENRPLRPVASTVHSCDGTAAARPGGGAAGPGPAGRVGPNRPWIAQADPWGSMVGPPSLSPPVS